MGRNISQIYSEAVATRNDYLQISSLNHKRSNSKLSVINIITYIMSVLIYSYETLLDVFQVQIAQLIAQRVSGTPDYYAQMALYFQYNPTTGMMDDIEFDETTFQAKFKNLDKTHRIIAKSAYQLYTNGIIIKVCKNTDSSTNDGGMYTALSTQELTAFKNYINEIKFVGAKVYCQSILGDILSINATVIYDDLYIDDKQALDNVKKALIDYIKTLDFNSYVYYQSVIDAMQKADHIISVVGPNEEAEEGKYAIVTLSEFDQTSKTYKAPQTITGRSTPTSGYLTFVDETNADRPSTIVADPKHLIFKANSQYDADKYN